MNTQWKETLKKHYKLIIILTVEFIAFAVLLLLVFLAGKKTYTITFDVNGGTLLSGEISQRIVQGQNATPPSVAKDGHYLLRWSGAYNKVTKDATVRAIWEYETTTGIEYDSPNNKTYCEISGCHPFISGDVYIGAYYNDKKILSIKKGAFESCSRITSIYMLDGVLDIGERAFADCTALEKIELPSTVLFLGKEAFIGCSELTELVLPTDLEYIGEGAFKNCTALEEITFPEGLIGIGAGAFEGCSSLKKINIPKSVVEIEADAFKDCKNLESVTLSKGLTTIGSSAFSGCDSLLEITLPETVEAIGVGAFDTAEMTVYTCAKEDDIPEGFEDGWYTEAVTVVWGHIIPEEEPEQSTDKPKDETDENSKNGEV